MKEKIYTIPINEVFDEECFCPFCTMERRLEEEEIKYTLGAAMMEPDFRAITNEKGFCQKHMAMLQSQPKALPLALVMDTHLDKISTFFDEKIKIKKTGIFKKGESISKYVYNFSALQEKCTVCDRIKNTIERYYETFLFMLKTDNTFFDKVLRGSGFCIPHYTKILRIAKRELSEEEFEKIIKALNTLEKNKVEKYRKDIKDFIESFEYHNASKPQNFPKDTVLKTTNLLNGEYDKIKKDLGEV